MLNPPGNIEAAHLFPCPDIGAVLETKAPPSMHQVRYLGWVYNDTPKETKLLKSSASSVHGVSFRGFHLTRPKRGGGYGCSPPSHAGNLLFYPLTGKTGRIILYRKIKYKREIVIDYWGIGGLEDCLVASG